LYQPGISNLLYHISNLFYTNQLLLFFGGVILCSFLPACDLRFWCSFCLRFWCVILLRFAICDSLFVLLAFLCSFCTSACVSLLAVLHFCLRLLGRFVISDKYFLFFERIRFVITIHTRMHTHNFTLHSIIIN
jgi:hypothetical protein